MKSNLRTLVRNLRKAAEGGCVMPNGHLWSNTRPDGKQECLWCPRTRTMCPQCDCIMKDGICQNYGCEG